MCLFKKFKKSISKKKFIIIKENIKCLWYYYKKIFFLEKALLNIILCQLLSKDISMMENKNKKKNSKTTMTKKVDKGKPKMKIKLGYLINYIITKKSQMKED